MGASSRAQAGTWDYVAEGDFCGGCPCRTRSGYGQRNQRERPRQSGKSELPHVRPLSVGECSSCLRALPPAGRDRTSNNVQCVASPRYLFEEIADATWLLFHHFLDHAAAAADVCELCLLLRAKSLAPNNRPPLPNRTRRPWPIGGAGAATSNSKAGLAVSVAVSVVNEFKPVISTATSMLLDVNVPPTIAAMSAPVIVWPPVENDSSL